MEEGYDSVVIVDGLPIIDQSKEERLVARIRKEFSRKGAPIPDDGIHMAWDKKAGKSKG